MLMRIRTTQIYEDLSYLLPTSMSIAQQQQQQQPEEQRQQCNKNTKQEQ